jgi:heme/copper-type cytochrome/quinol oxidase subunit 2
MNTLWNYIVNIELQLLGIRTLISLLAIILIMVYVIIMVICGLIKAARSQNGDESDVYYDNNQGQ